MCPGRGRHIQTHPCLNCAATAGRELTTDSDIAKLLGATRRTLARALTLYVSLLSLTKEGRQELVSVGGPVGFIPAADDDFLPLLPVRSWPTLDRTTRLQRVHRAE